MTVAAPRALDPIHVPLVGRHLVEASAGTGKTYTITTLFVRLVVEAGLTADQILVVTFTRAATAELRDRIRRRLRDALDVLDGAPSPSVAKDAGFLALVAGWDPTAARRRLVAAVQAFDLAPISTIHGFCQRALRENAFESGVAFDLELAEDRGPLVRQVAQDFWTRRLHDADRTFVEWLQGELSFGTVVDLAAQAVRPASPVVLPETPPPGLADHGARLGAAFREARTAWRRSGADAVRLIHEGGLLDGKSYQTGRTWKHADALHKGLEADALPFGVEEFEKALDYLDPARMTSKRSKAALEADTPVPTNDALDAVGRLRAAWDAAVDAFVAERVRLCRALMDEAPDALKAARSAGRELQFFDDLIVDLARALEHPDQGPPLAAALRGRYRAALLDEFQDTDPVQWAIFDRVWSGDDARLYLIGDPKQAIYAFRGADLFAYLRARDSVPPAHRWDLDTNHRSDRPLVEAVNRLFQLGPRPFADDGIPFHPVKAAHPSARLRIDGAAVPPLELRMHRSRGWGRLKEFADAHEIPDVVADGIVDLLDGRADLVVSPPGAPEVRRPLDPGDVAVLVSSHPEAAEVQAALERRGVPCVRYGNVRVYATPEAWELQALLEAVTRPGDVRAVRAALVTRLLGVTGDGLADLERDDAGLRTWLERFRGWRATWDARGFMRMFQAVLHDTDALPRVLRTEGGERCLTNLRHLAELVHAAEVAQGLEPLGALAWLVAQQTGRGDGDSPAEVRLESDERAVQVVTMHASKGLEYPVVFCPYVWRPTWVGAFPSFHDDDGRLALQLHPEAHPDDGERALAEARAERLRLAYVALTRAKNLCVVTWGRFPGYGTTFAHGALAHLLHPPPDGGLPGSDAAAVVALDDAALYGAARKLAEASDGTMAVRWVERDLPRRHQRDVAPIVLRQPPGLPPRTWTSDLRVSSYSGLVRAAHEERAERDVDAVVTPAPAAVVSTLRLARFPKGAAPGTAYHAAMEGLDFRALDTPAARAHVAAALAAHGVDAELHADAVLGSIVDVCGASLGDGAPRLADVPLSDRLDELGFTLPAGGDAPLTPARLAAAFEAHAPERLRGAVAARLRDLRFPPLDGFLKGFVDLSFRADGRWYVVDYKTNHLGPTLDDYGPDAVDRAMIEGDYVLQYHLYVLALHRFLRRRVPGWDYARDFGGVRYLFVRGMTPETGPDRGVFSDRPSPAMIDALDDALGRVS